MASTLDQVLGYGLIRPFRHDGKSDFAAAGGVALVRAAVGQILGTMAGNGTTTQGEIPWRTEFGSLLHLLRHRKLDITTQALARTWVTDALSRWEPRVRVSAVEVSAREVEAGKGLRAMVIRVVYNVLAEPRAGSMVLLQGAVTEVPLAA